MTSNTTAEKATDTLSESIFELIGTFKILFDRLKILLEIPFSSDPIMIATDFLKFELYIVSFPFSERLIMSISKELKCKIASFILLTLAIGILNTPPDEVLTTSEFTGAELFWGIIIPSTLAATAVLIIAPKFLVSVIPSSNKYVFGELSSNVVDTKSSIDNNFIGDNTPEAFSEIIGKGEKYYKKVFGRNLIQN